MISAIYGRVAQLRRSWYARPHARVRLACPVISVGNLVVGGSGKTPIVASLARTLQAWGERPAVLSRGYARRRDADGVLVVSDGSRVLVPVEESGDEPLMLARALPGVPVLVSRDRQLAGVLAERRFAATVLLLDDGFQHLQLARTVDLLLVAPADLDDRVLPSGRLREPLDAARAADACLVHGTPDDAVRVKNALGVEAVFTVTRRFHPIRSIGGAPVEGRRALAVAGIARPERFFAALAENGLDVAGTMAFPDHHWFTAADVSRAIERAQAVDADVVVTTEKDAVRLERMVAGGTPWAVLPMEAAIEPAAEFESWLRARL